MLKKQVNRFVEKVRALHGDPHYVALGMGIGVFVAITPTIPFHTILVILLAVVFKASKPAAILGVWVSNPFTVVFLYFACYKTGHLFFEDASGGLESIYLLIEHLEGDFHYTEKLDHFVMFMKTQLRTFMIMNFGGIVLGVPAGVGSYYVTRVYFDRRKARRAKKQERKNSGK